MGYRRIGVVASVPRNEVIKYMRSYAKHSDRKIGCQPPKLLNPILTYMLNFALPQNIH